MSSNPSSRSEGPIRSEYAGDPEMRDLVELFVSELPERMQAVMAALTERRGQDLFRLTHQLKGASAGYGFAPIGEAAAKVESLVRSRPIDEELDAVKAGVDELVELCRRAVV